MCPRCWCKLRSHSFSRAARAHVPVRCRVCARVCFGSLSGFYWVSVSLLRSQARALLWPRSPWSCSFRSASRLAARADLLARRWVALRGRPLAPSA